jgi:hypothetical protein
VGFEGNVCGASIGACGEPVHSSLFAGMTYTTPGIGTGLLTPRVVPSGFIGVLNIAEEQDSGN